MNMDAFSEEQSTIEPPKYDMLYIKFRGDRHETVLPYCEVANGDIVDVHDGALSIRSHNPGETGVSLSYGEFVSIIEKAFDTKEIVEMSVQKKRNPDVIKIL